MQGHIYALEAKTVNDLYAQYERAYVNMQIQLESIAKRYGAGETWSASDSAFRERTEVLVSQIMSEMRALARQSTDTTLQAAVDSYNASFYGRAWMVDTLTGGKAAVPLLPAEAVRAAILAPYEGSTFVDRFKGNEDEFQRRIRQSIVQSQIGGESIYTAQKRLAQELGIAIGRRTNADKAANTANFFRTQMIARTEILRSSNQGSLAVYEANKDVLRGWEWITAHDDRTCFPAGTKVLTDNGNVNIESVTPGTVVKTSRGMRRVSWVGRKPYAGNFVTVQAGALGFTATADHRVWTARGWIRADAVLVGDNLKSDNNQLLNVRSTHQFAFSNADYVKTILDKVFIFAPILFRIAMPIVSIYLEGGFINKEVDGVAPDLSLLNVVNAKRVQRLADHTLKTVFTTKATIAPNATKISICGRLFSKFFTAMKAVNKNGGATTQFGAMLTSWVFGAKTSATHNAILVKRIGASTFEAANRIPIRFTFKNSEGLIANGANLVDGFGSPVGVVTFPTAPLRVWASWFCKHALSATHADDLYTFVSGCMITLNRAILTLISVGGGKVVSAVGAYLIKHSYIISRAVNNYHSVWVYDLTVEDTHEFFANGLLVHNCEECAPLDGKFFEFGSGESPPPLHVNCRCSAAPAAKDVDLEARIVGPRETFTEWARNKGIEQSRYGGAYNLPAQKPPKSRRAA